MLRKIGTKRGACSGRPGYLTGIAHPGRPHVRIRMSRWVEHVDVPLCCKEVRSMHPRSLKASNNPQKLAYGTPRHLAEPSSNVSPRHGSRGPAGTHLVRWGSLVHAFSGKSF